MDEVSSRGRRPARYLSVSSGRLIGIGQAVYEEAGKPAYVRPIWDGTHVILERAERPATRRQGIVKVMTKYKIVLSAKPVIEAAGLVNGRYHPTHVSHAKIVFAPTPAVVTDDGAAEEADDAAV